MLGAAQALAVAVFWHQIWEMLRSSRLRVLAGVGLVLLVTSLCISQLNGLDILSKETVRPALTRFLESGVFRGPVFYAPARIQEGLPTLLRSSRKIGRDFHTPIQVIGIRGSDVCDIGKLVESLDVEATIVGDGFSEKLECLKDNTAWAATRVTDRFVAFDYRGAARGQQVYTLARDPVDLSRDDTALIPYTAMPWGSANSIAHVIKLDNGLLERDVDVPTDLERVAILVCSFDRDFKRDGEKSRSFEVMLNDHRPCIASMAIENHMSIGTAWCIVDEPIRAGAHKLSVRLMGHEDRVFIDDVVIVGIATPDK